MSGEEQLQANISNHEINLEIQSQENFESVGIRSETVKKTNPDEVEILKLKKDAQDITLGK